MKKTGNNTNTLKICEYVAFFFVFLMTILVIDFVTGVVKDERSYEIRQEADENTDNGQQIYRLYIDGEYYGDIDYNLYNSRDENGNTDYRYCYIIGQVRGLVFALIVMCMAIVVLLIASNSKDTPFTAQNTARIRLIGALQFALAIIPGLAELIMKFFRFSYASTGFNFEGLYMFVVGCVIMILAEVFNYGVKLQQDNDLIA